MTEQKKEAAAEIERLRAKLAKVEAERIVSPAECDENCDDPDCPYSHVPLTLQAAYENSASRMKDAEARAEAAEKQLAEARAVIAPLINRYNEITQITRGRRWATYVEMDHLRAAAEWMEQIAGPDDMRAPLGARFTIDHDGFVGTVIGYYRRHDGKRGVVLQQDGTKVVHVYGEKWLKAEQNR